jgi:nucleotide-binding universal stress UspA family protein
MQVPQGATGMALQVSTHIAIKKILFATDFSWVSEAALPFAVALAHRFDSTIEAMHVLAPGELEPPLPDAAPIFMEGAFVRAEQAMAELLRSDRFEGVPHEGRVCRGIEIWAEIESVIESEKIDLVVLGTHGREGLKQVILGSVAETIFRSAPCPVMVIGPKVPKKTAQPAFRDLLFATDLSPASLRALPFVQAFAEENRAEMLVLHVTQEKVHSRKEQALTAESLGKWMRELIPPKPHLEYEVLFGSPAENIIKVASERQCDLIMLGAHHASSFATHLPGAVAHRIVSEAPCPVMTVHWQESAPLYY